MKTKTAMSVLFAAVFAAVMAAPAAAQTQDQNSAASTVVAANDAAPVSFDMPATVSFDTQAKPSPTHQMGGKQVTIDIQGGFVTGGGAHGLDVGVGASFLPMKDNDKFGIIVDGNFIHLSAGGFSSNGIYISANGVYNIHMQNSKAKPFAGAGLAITHADSVTNTDLQILAGVGWALSSGREVNGQVRFVFISNDTTTVLLFGFAF